MEAGHYARVGDKVTLLHAICGESGTEENPSRRWRNLWLDGGTTIERFLDFIEEIIQDIGPGTPERRYCFTMDNLNTHHNPAVRALIYGWGHRLAFRAPYYAVDGPIEYTFNTIQTLVRSNMHNIRNTQDLMDSMGNAIQAIVDHEPYFLHCGFWR